MTEVNLDDRPRRHTWIHPPKPKEEPIAPAPDPRQNLLLAALPASELQRWLSLLEPVSLELDQVLHEPARVPHYLYFPTTAVVSLLNVSEDGVSDEFAVVGCEGVVGVSLLMDGQSTPGRAAVQSAGQALRVPARSITDEWERSAAVRNLMLRYALALGWQVAQTSACNLRHTVGQRLCRRLLQGLDRQPGRELVTTQEQLAALLGVRRESVTMEAHKLQEAKCVRYARGHITVLDRAGLERRACQCHEVVETEYRRLLPMPNPAAESLTAPVGSDYLPGHAADARADATRSPADGPAGLATHLHQVREQERGELAGEIENELAALLIGAQLEIAQLQLRLTLGPRDVGQRIRHLSDTVNSSIALSRRVAEDLRRSCLSVLSLTASLQMLAREFKASFGIEMATHLEEPEIDEPIQLAVYAMVQQSLNNAGKYSRPSAARIGLIDCGSDIVVTVCDNGQGFDAGTQGAPDHAVTEMRDRVQACGGQLTVSSAPGWGTLVVGVLPKGHGVATRPPITRGTTPGRAWGLARPHGSPSQALDKR